MFYLSSVIFSSGGIIHPFKNILFAKVGPDIVVENGLVPYPLVKGLER